MVPLIFVSQMTTAEMGQQTGRRKWHGWALRNCGIEVSELAPRIVWREVINRE